MEIFIPPDLIQSIYEGSPNNCFEDPSHLNLLYESYKKVPEENACPLEENNNDLFPKLEQLQRIHEMRRQFQWVPVPEEYHRRLQKSSHISTLLREKATECQYSNDATFQTKPLRGYNLAIAFALPNSIELAFALEKRADLLIKLGHSELAQLDIHAAALIPSYAKNNNGKRLIDLQRRCCSNAIATNSTNAKGVRRKFLDKSLYEIPSKNGDIEKLADSCEIDYHPRCGRRVVVNRDVRPGEVLMVDSPFSIILQNILNWDVEHCTNCSRPVMAGVPCDGCTFAWFCSTSCKAEACGKSGGGGSLHKYECGYLSYLKITSIMSLKGLLAARVLFKVGPDELYRIFRERDPEYFYQDFSTSSGICYSKKSSLYLPIFHLITHENSPSKSQSNAFKSLLLTHLIEDTSSFFSRYKSSEDFQHFKDFISSLILRHMEAIEFNAITLSELLSQGQSRQTHRYGAGVYPLLSLINHSCDPNCVPLRSLNYLKTAVIAMKPLKPGDEVTFSYAPHFAQMECDKRQRFLRDKYQFSCKCEACENWWGPGSVTRIILENQCNFCGKYLLTGQCPRCAEKDVRAREGVGVVQGELDRVRSVMAGNKEWLSFWEGLLFGVVRDCLEFCGDYLEGNYWLCLEVQEVFKEGLVGVVNCCN